MKEENYEELRQFALKEGASLFGVGRIEPVRSALHPSIADPVTELVYGISFGFRLSDAILDTIQDEPTLIYKHHYRAVNQWLDQVSLRISDLIQARGFKALSIPASQVVDWESQFGHLPHILIAEQAGLGWIGRCNLLVNQKYGARVRYSTVLTDIPLKVDEPIGGDCGDCRECLEVCPAGAITERGYDKASCISKLREFSRIKGIGVMICGICVKACRGRTISKNANPKSK